MKFNEMQVGFGGDKLDVHHLERLAVVYVRQSTVQQVLDHQESTRLQYGLSQRAEALGWATERILVIDEDLGKSGSSAEGRSGFQRLVSEVSLNHVGLILGVEMSRLARSCKDWHQLLEVCAWFNTLIADLDGIYDPSQYNDRLLLGLKGTMSEAELHLLKQRMHQGKLSKANRGELQQALPTGYIRHPSGEVVFDPDEQVQQVVRLIFAKFEELGTINAVLRYLVKHGIDIGVRVKGGIHKGELEWRRPNRSTLQGLLKNPAYAGAYVFGRRSVSSRQEGTGHVRLGSVRLKPEDWQVFIPDRLPAYISWEQYQRNIAQMKANQSRADAPGHIRRGPSLLAGLLICGKCGCRLTVRYVDKSNYHSYQCVRQTASYAAPGCQSIPGAVLNQYVSQGVLAALEPAALELSLEAVTHLKQERTTLEQVWQQRIERAVYEAERAGRHYRLVEPENRLVARQLAKEWEEKLLVQQQIQEEYHRFEREQPRYLTEAEEQAIRQLANNIPALWHAETTTDAQRKEIVRQVISRIIVDANGDTEQVRVVIEWVGGFQTEEIVLRPVAKLSQLSYYPQLCDRVRNLAQQGLLASQIAEQLNQEGFRPPKRHEKFGTQGVLGLMRTLNVYTPRTSKKTEQKLAQNEWWLATLAQEIDMSAMTLFTWIRKGWVKAYQQSESKRWVIWADPQEVERLRQHHQQSTAEFSHQRWLEEKP